MLSPAGLSTPTETDFLTISDNFYKRWQMPFCLGAIDGKYIRIVAPPNSGSLYFNYKKYFRIILMGICNANYNFKIVNVGAYGCISDGGVFAQTEFGQDLYSC